MNNQIPGLRSSGSRATEIIKTNDSHINHYRIQMRNLSKEEFIQNKGSGTLRKNQSIGMNVSSHYLAERVAYEFGYYFEICPERFLTWGEPRSEGDEKALTEVGWHVERYASICLVPGDEMECKYLTVEQDDKREGIGIIIRKTSAPWVPVGYTVFCIITEYDPKNHCWKEAKNPC